MSEMQEIPKVKAKTNDIGKQHAKNQFTKAFEKSKELIDRSIHHRKHYENSEIKRIWDEIENLKNFKSLKYPDYTLQQYLYHVSELEHEYEKVEISLNTDESNLIDMEFINNVIKNDTLFDKENIKYKSKYRDRVLHEACKLKSGVKLVQLLIANGADKYKRNFLGQSILHIAVSANNSNLVEYLLKKENGEIDKTLLEFQTNEEKQTALHYAARNGRYDALITIKRLLTDDFLNRIEEIDYQNRTCLYLAAEYGNEQIVQLLIDLGCEKNVTNLYGQKALYWIISKCPQISKSVLDKYLEPGEYSLTHVELQPKEDSSAIPSVQSILELIVDTNNLELISHPMISDLINVKWREFGLLRSYIDLFFSLLYIVLWHLLSTLVPAQEKHIYNFPQDGWRIFLWICGSIGIVVLIIIEIIEFYSSSEHDQKVLKLRNEELHSEKSHPHDRAQNNRLEQEKLLCRKKNMYMDYISDPWNWYDIISIILLITVICTHIADVCNHSELLAIWHNRIFAISVIVVSMRAFEIGRFVNKKFGVLVIILVFLAKKIIVWLLVYFITLLPFTTAIFAIFSGKRFQYEDDSTEPTFCRNSLNINEANCTSIEIPIWHSYDKIVFDLWTKTFGRSFDLDTMKQIDPIMTQILVGNLISNSILYISCHCSVKKKGLFIGLFALLLTNVFIALLSSAFDRVYSSAEAYFLMQRAIKLINIEHQPFFKSKRKNHLKSLKDQKGLDKSGKLIKPDNDFNDEVFNALNQLRCDMNIMSETITELNAKMSLMSQKPIETNNKESTEPIDENDDCKNLLVDINEMKLFIKQYLNDY